MCVFGVILVRIFPAFSRIRTEYGEIQSISPYLVRMMENAGKMRTRITPHTNTFTLVESVPCNLLSDLHWYFWIFRTHFVILFLFFQLWFLIFPGKLVYYVGEIKTDTLTWTIIVCHSLSEFLGSSNKVPA